MRSAKAALLSALALVAGAGPAAHADPRGALSAFVSRLTVRTGVAHGSLVVLPILLDEPAGAAATGLAPIGGTDAWDTTPDGASLVELVAGTRAPPVERFVPTGTLVAGGEGERMTGRPVALKDAEHARVVSPRCDSAKTPAKPAGDRRLGGLAPLEQRKLQLLGRHDDSLALLQRVQAIIAGLPASTTTVADVLESKFAGDVQRVAWNELQRIPKAFAGRTVGHVAFFGFRPVEVVVFANPADYQALGPAYLRSLALSHALWHEAVGLNAEDADGMAIRRLVAEGTAVVGSFARANPREWMVVSERTRWKLFVASVESDPRAGGHTEKFACRFAVDEHDEVRHVEAVESGSDRLFPTPYREPGGRAVDEPPSNKGDGGLGPDALEALARRMRENRAALNGGR